MKPTDRIFVALDTTDLDRAVSLANQLVGLVGGVKMGKEFLTAHGPEGVRRVAECGMPIFLDTKFHDHSLDRTIWILSFAIISSTEPSGYQFLRTFPRQNNLDIKFYDHFLD